MTHSAQLHEEAMELADEGDRLRRRGDPNGATRAFGTLSLALMAGCFPGLLYHHPAVPDRSSSNTTAVNGGTVTASAPGEEEWMNPISLTEAETNLLTQMVTLARPFRTEPYLIVNRVGDLTETSRLRPCDVPESLEDQYRRWTIATAPLKVDVQGVSVIPPYSSLNAF